jgi:hypothetical protein
MKKSDVVIINNIVNELSEYGVYYKFNKIIAYNFYNILMKECDVSECNEYYEYIYNLLHVGDNSILYRTIYYRFIIDKLKFRDITSDRDKEHGIIKFIDVYNDYYVFLTDGVVYKSDSDFVSYDFINYETYITTNSYVAVNLIENIDDVNKLYKLFLDSYLKIYSFINYIKIDVDNDTFNDKIFDDLYYDIDPFKFYKFLNKFLGYLIKFKHVINDENDENDVERYKLYKRYYKIYVLYVKYIINNYKFLPANKLNALLFMI